MNLSDFSELKFKIKDVVIMAFSYECSLKDIDLSLYSFDVRFKTDILKDKKMVDFLESTKEKIGDDSLIFIVTRKSDGVRSGTRFSLTIDAKNTLHDKVLVAKRIAMHFCSIMEEFIQENPIVEIIPH